MMRQFQLLLWAAVLVSWVSTADAADNSGKKGEFVSLFNGRALFGPKVNRVVTGCGVTGRTRILYFESSGGFPKGETVASLFDPRKTDSHG